MKSIFQHITLSLLSFCFLFSTMSFSINAHYCGNILVDKQVMLPAEKCAMHDADDVHQKDKDDCCNESNHTVDGQDELQVNLMDDIQLPVLALSFPADNFSYELLYDRLKTTTHYQDRAPPGKKYSYQILYQSFLI